MLPEEVTRLIGKRGDPVVMEVERGGIKKYADAVGDTNPLYWEDEYARSTRYGSIITPPGFFGWPVKWTGAMPFSAKIRDDLINAISAAGYSRPLDGGIEYEFNQPVRAGDILVAVMKVADIYERESKGRMLVFSLIEESYTNRYGALVAVVRRTLIFR